MIKSLQVDYDGDYVGMHIVHDGKKFTMYQPKMTHCCLKVLPKPLPDNNKHKIKTQNTPVTPKSMLHADSGRARRKCTLNYQAAISILNYLQAMMRPDFTFAVHCCARHCNTPKLCHEQELKYVCRYLAGTLDKGYVLAGSDQGL